MEAVTGAESVRYLDYDDALRRLGGNKNVLNSLLRKFIDGGSDASIRSAVEKGDAEAVREASHTLKGLSANLSMPALREAAAALEAAIKNNEEPGDLPERVYEAWNNTVYAANEVLSK